MCSFVKDSYGSTLKHVSYLANETFNKCNIPLPMTSSLLKPEEMAICMLFLSKKERKGFATRVLFLLTPYNISCIRHYTAPVPFMIKILQLVMYIELKNS